LLNNTQVGDLKLKQIEVVVYWQNYVINVYHFLQNQSVKLGDDYDIRVPNGLAPNGWTLLDFSSDVAVINTTPEMKIEATNNIRSAIQADREQSQYKLSELETYTLHLSNSIKLKIRYVEPSPFIIANTSFLLNLKQQLTLGAVLIFTLLTSWYISYISPTDLVEANTVRESKVVFTNLQLKPIEPEVVDKASEPIKKSEKATVKVKEKQPVVKKSGLLAAFGASSTKNKLDKINSKSIDYDSIGKKNNDESDVSFGTQGANLNIKDTGAGAGANIQGVSKINTKGRSAGMTGYGNAGALGAKDKIQITTGGQEEVFVGSIDKDAVRRVVRSILSQYKSCYEREFRKNGKLEGKVVIKWEIHQGGIAKNAQILKDKTTLNNSTVEECVKAKILSLKFPEPPAKMAAEVTYPFIFIPDKFTQGEE